jgi:hypothetical protein
MKSLAPSGRWLVCESTVRLGKRGLMMMKTFGFLVCVFATMSASQAALLASYTFTGNKNATSVASGLTASAFTGGGPVRTSDNGNLGWYDHNQRSPEGPVDSVVAGAVNLTADAGLFVRLTKVVLKYRSRGSLATPATNAKIFAGISTTSSSVFDPSGTSANGQGNNQSNLDNFFTWEYLVTDGTFNSTAAFDVLARTSGSTVAPDSFNRNLNIDSIEVFGDVVPEPASMAIFGLFGVGAVAGRFRRRK